MKICHFGKNGFYIIVATVLRQADYYYFQRIYFAEYLTWVRNTFLHRAFLFLGTNL